MWWQRKHLQNASSGKKQSAQQSMQYAMLSFGIKRDEIIRLFPICLYMHTMNLEGWDKTRKEVTNSGYKGRRKGDFTVHLLIFCDFWTIYYPWKTLKNKRLTNLPKFTELERAGKAGIPILVFKICALKHPTLGFIWSLLLSKGWTPGGLMAREWSVPQLSFLWASWSSTESTGVGFLVFSFGFHCKRDSLPTSPC